MDKFIAWVVTSWADPNKVSLPVKGLLISAAPVARGIKTMVLEQSLLGDSESAGFQGVPTETTRD